MILFIYLMHDDMIYDYERKLKLREERKTT